MKPLALIALTALAISTPPALAQDADLTNFCEGTAAAANVAEKDKFMEWCKAEGTHRAHAGSSTPSPETAAPSSLGAGPPGQGHLNSVFGRLADRPGKAPMLPPGNPSPGQPQSERAAPMQNPQVKQPQQLNPYGCAGPDCK